MSNMSYCKYQNTLSDLRQVLSSIKEEDEIQSLEERQAAISLLREVASFVIDSGLVVNHFGDSVDVSFDDGKLHAIVDHLCSRQVLIEKGL